MTFYEFGQMNSGGSFKIDNNVSEYVIIESKTAKEAIKKLKSFTSNYGSCECCGDRWSYYPDKLKFPLTFKIRVMFSDLKKCLKYGKIIKHVCEIPTTKGLKIDVLFEVDNLISYIKIHKIQVNIIEVKPHKYVIHYENGKIEKY